MAINPNIILGIQTPKFQIADPLESAHKSLALQALMGQQEMQGMQLQQGRRAMESEDRLRALFGENPNATPEDVMRIDPVKGMKMRQDALKNRETEANINKTRAEVMGKLATMQRERMGALIANPNAEDGIAAVNEFGALARSLGAPNLVQGQDRLIAAIRQNADNPTALKTIYARLALNAKDLLPQLGSRDIGGAVQSTAADPITGKITVTDTAYKNDPNKPFALTPEGAKPNAPYQEYELRKARAGATSVNVNTTEKPFLTQLGEGVGKNIIGDFDQARAAVQTLNNARQLETALGNVMAGPAANARVTLSQIGQALGVNGKDDTEKLVNTRMAIQALARQELAAAGQMKGQGQITENEREILRKAEAGNISDMTVPELRAYLSAVRKTANYKIGLHQSNVERLKKNPNAAPVVDFLNVNVPEQGPAPVDPAAVDAALKKYGASR